jgi:predicted nucleic acid-binding Zn ribbon protein
VRRVGPRPLASALGEFTREATPAALLARVQAVWPEVAGEVVASEAEPVSERAGAVSFSCGSGVWANELELLSPNLIERLNEALGGADGGPVKRLRFRVL